MSARSALDRGTGAPAFLRARIAAMCAPYDRFWLQPSGQTVVGGKISVWPDAFGLHNHSQGTDANRPAAIAIPGGTAAGFNTAHLLVGAGAFAASEVHTISFALRRNGVNGATDDHLHNPRNDALRSLLIRHLADSSVWVHSDLYDASTVVVPAAIQTLTACFNGTAWRAIRDSVSAAGATLEASHSVTGSYLGNYGPAPANGVVADIASVVYVAAWLPLLHLFHRQYARTIWSAP